MGPIDTSKIGEPLRRTKVHRIRMTEVHQVVSPIKPAIAPSNPDILPAECGPEAQPPGPRTKLVKVFSSMKTVPER